MTRNLRASLVAGVCAMAIAGTATAQQAITYDIPSGELAAALQAYTRQSDQQIIYRIEDVRGLQGKRVRGNLSPLQALQQMLEGTSLEVRRDGSGAYVVRRAARVQEAPVTPVRAGVMPIAALSVQALPTEAPEAQAAEPSVVDAVIVTGSRIARPDLEVASPVTVIGREELSHRQVNAAEDLLSNLPSVRPSIGSASNQGGNGAATVDLRGLGDNRTLVLVDGRRMVPFGLDGVVDLNIVPMALVERVDLVTGGASSVYGADAVAGVVNFITRRNFTGVEIQSNYRLSERGDAQQYRTDLTLGADLDGGRGNVVMSLGYMERDPLELQARSISQFPISSVNGLFQGSSGAVPAIFQSPSGLPTAGIGSVIDPSTGAFRPATQADTFNTFIGSYLQTPLERTSLYTSGYYEISPRVEVYASGLFTRNKAHIAQASSGTFSNAYQLPLNNPYLPAAARDQLCAAFDTDRLTPGIQPISAASCLAAGSAVGGPGTPGYMEIPIIPSRRFLEWGARGNEIDSTVFQLQAGVRGELTDTIRYDVSAQYGETTQNQLRTRWGSSANVQQALRAYATADGPVCSDTSAGCVPLNLFGALGSITPEQLEFIALDSQIRRNVTQAVVTGSISGDMGRITSPLAYNPVAFSVGAEYREVSAEVIPDAVASVQGALLGLGSAQPADFGEFSVREIFGEIIVPVIEDGIVHNATVEAGVRYSDYSTTGGSTTWKIGGSVEFVPGIKLRAMYQNAVRSPNIVELFRSSGQALGNLTVDPCAGATPSAPSVLCSATGAPTGVYGSIPQPSSGQINVTVAGNRNLDVEQANTYTVGLVLNPPSWGGFSATLDYFNIKIEDQISAPSQTDILDGCYSRALNPSQTPNVFCSLISRNPLTGGLNGAGETPGVILTNSNLGQLETAGIDWSASYRFDLADYFEGHLGTVRLSTGGTWLDYYHTQATPNSINRDCTGYYSTACGNPRPEWKWNVRGTYTRDRLSASLLWTHITGVDLEPGAPADRPAFSTPQTGNAAFNSIVPAFRQIGSYDWFDLSVNYSLTEDAELSFLIENLLDEAPPLVGNGVSGFAFNDGNTFPNVYDMVGRIYTVGLRMKF
jgi:iron complex outermembrane receptor protein